MIDERSHRDRLIVDHWYICRRAARRFVRPGLDRADLEQIAAIGLIKAADRYDVVQTTPFEAYAWLLAVGELMHYVRDNERLMRAPRRVQELERRWLSAERELSALLGREPRDGDVARYINATPSESEEVRAYRASRSVTSLELVTTCEQQLTYQTSDGVIDELTVDSMLSTLTPLEQRIVRSIHLDEMPVSVLAKRLGYSRRHVTRLHRQALTRLRNQYACGA
jgi:RNA polymerase sigma-B factor